MNQQTAKAARSAGQRQVVLDGRPTTSSPKGPAHRHASFYAVRNGRTPGVYHNWNGSGGCLEQIKGFRGAAYREFGNLVDAETYLGGGECALRGMLYALLVLMHPSCSSAAHVASAVARCGGARTAAASSSGQSLCCGCRQERRCRDRCPGTCIAKKWPRKTNKKTFWRGASNRRQQVRTLAKGRYPWSRASEMPQRFFAKLLVVNLALQREGVGSWFAHTYATAHSDTAGNSSYGYEDGEWDGGEPEPFFERRTGT
jgi:hypothetical protein